MKQRREEGLRKLNQIVEGVTREQMLSREPKAFIYCSVKILSHFQEVLFSRQRICDWKRKRQYRMAKTCYENLLRLFIPERSCSVVLAVIDVLEQEDLWEIEDLCQELLRSLLDFKVSGAAIAHAMWNKVEASTADVEKARAIIRVLYDLLDEYDWPEVQDTIDVVKRVLDLYHDCVTASSPETTASHAPLRKGIEVCIRRTLEHISSSHLLISVRHMCSWSVAEDTNDDSILDFGSILEYAAFLHQPTLYEKTLTPELFPLLMQMIASQSRLVSLLGNRVLQYLIDRNDNRAQFDTPKIFFENTQFDLKIHEYNREDKLFLKTHREELHDSLLKSMMNHCTTRLNLETTYCTICMMAVEVPCGFTAAALVCLSMNLQDVTLENVDLRREVAYQIHATVMAIMSLICYIHQAKVFYIYVNKIMMERAQWAPHLNPPLQSIYSFATHHVLWDKPELFFVDWEARYGLWKCFRLQADNEGFGEPSNT